MTVDLRFYESVLTGAGILGHFRPRGDEWTRSIRGMGGFWHGRFVPPETANHHKIFASWLGSHVQERASGGVTWVGLVYEMEIEHEGIRRRRTLDLVGNAIACDYQDEGAVATTAYSTQAQSIARYGRKEEIINAGDVPSATAQGLRDRYLAGHAWPWARPVSLGFGDKTKLEIRVCGYVFTAQWMYVQAGDGAEHDLDHWIAAIVGTAEGLSSDHGGSVSGAGDCQFLSAGNLASNTLQIKEEATTKARAWAKIAEIAGLGDSSGDPWRVWVDQDRNLHYQQVDLSPRYYLRDGGLYNTAGGRVAENPWALRPAVVRDMGYPIRLSSLGSMLEDARDLYVEEVEVTAGGAVSLKTAIFDESEILAAQARLE